MSTPIKITCQICGELVHSIEAHLAKKHPDTNMGQYAISYPSAPVLSDFAKEELRKMKPEVVKTPAAAVEKPAPSANGFQMLPFDKVFGLPVSSATKKKDGSPIMVKVFDTPADPKVAALIPEIDRDFVFDVGLLKLCLMTMALNQPGYLWGHAGVGKSTVWEQIGARTNRPVIRMQHTRQTEPFEILGQMNANKDGTFFQPGPLPIAMRTGCIYIGDEYDMTQPGIAATYQAVLEGKQLIIPDADPEWRRVPPHPNFFFAATGNTNGAGDESDLYAGTLIQNYATYSRFGMVEHVDYMKPEAEEEILIRKTRISAENAKRMVQFAGLVRKAYANKDISAPIGPRELLFCARNGHALANYAAGIMLGYLNKLRSSCSAKGLEFAMQCFPD